MSAHKRSYPLSKDYVICTYGTDSGIWLAPDPKTTVIRVGLPECPAIRPHLIKILVDFAAEFPFVRGLDALAAMLFPDSHEQVVAQLKQAARRSTQPGEVHNPTTDEGTEIVFRITPEGNDSDCLMVIAALVDGNVEGVVVLVNSLQQDEQIGLGPFAIGIHDKLPPALIKAAWDWAEGTNGKELWMFMQVGQDAARDILNPLEPDNIVLAATCTWEGQPITLIGFDGEPECAGPGVTYIAHGELPGGQNLRVVSFTPDSGGAFAEQLNVAIGRVLATIGSGLISPETFGGYYKPGRSPTTTTVALGGAFQSDASEETRPPMGFAAMVDDLHSGRTGDATCEIIPFLVAQHLIGPPSFTPGKGEVDPFNFENTVWGIGNFTLSRPPLGFADGLMAAAGELDLQSLTFFLPVYLDPEDALDSSGQPNLDPVSAKAMEQAMEVFEKLLLTSGGELSMEGTFHDGDQVVMICVWTLPVDQKNKSAQTAAA